jgi:hypothetical protein
MIGIFFLVFGFIDENDTLLIPPPSSISIYIHGEKKKKNRKKLCSRFLDVLVNLKNGYGSGESLVILVMVPI